MLYFYNNQFGVCGTGRTTEKLILNNSQEAIIGYYDNSKVLHDISFSINKNIALVNNGLNYDDAEELLEIIKTVNITYNSIPDFEILFYAKIQQRVIKSIKYQINQKQINMTIIYMDTMEL